MILSDREGFSFSWVALRKTLFPECEPALVLSDSGSDGFSAMELYFEIKQKHADIPVIVDKAKGFDVADRIKAAIVGTFSEKAVPHLDKYV
jgi:DNA-binding NtrC family response regulator